jgi:hypothetical protein
MQMARPPVEWPIPQYVLELRERVIVTCGVPAQALAERVPLPVQPLTTRGTAAVSLCLGNVRVLRSAGGVERLASEFHVMELLTPVVWRPACRPPLRGNCILGSYANAAGIRRLLRTGAGLEVGALRLGHTPGKPGHAWHAAAEGSSAFHLRLPKPLEEIAWPAASAFSSHEAAEAQLLHPEVVFFRDRDGRAVHAVPVHQYARATVHAEAELGGVAELVGELLGAPGEVALDHVLFQKRCTHTFFFPPERIPTATPPPAVTTACRRDVHPVRQHALTP